MRVLITNSTDKEEHIQEVENYTAAKHWITNHLDLSKKWSVQDITSATVIVAKETNTYKVRGSHRTEREIKAMLGCDPGIHSGTCGKGGFCVRVTVEEHKLLTEAGIKINKRKGY